MKTLEAFIQRLQDDAAFEKEAQAFVTEAELMAFVRRAGYDFTLEELMEQFQHEASVPGESEVISHAANHAASSEKRNHNFRRQPLGKDLQSLSREMVPPEAAGKAPLEFIRGGGGRHRGFSPQRLKYSAAEEP